MCEVWKRIMRMNGKKDGVLMACYACLLVIGGLLTWLKYDYNAVKMEDVKVEGCAFENPDGGIVVVLMNRGDEAVNGNVFVNGELVYVELGAHSIGTLVL